MSDARAQRLAAAVAARELDALLVTEPVNLRYVTGFTGTNGLAVVGAGVDGARVFVTDFRYVERAADEVRGFDRRRGGRDLFDDVAGALPDERPLRLGWLPPRPVSIAWSEAGRRLSWRPALAASASNIQMNARHPATKI